MSSNRLIYDNCAYSQKLSQNTKQGNYMMFPDKYENPNQCRIMLGQVGGNEDSIFTGNMVDLESDLFGIDRPSSLCNNSKFKPKTNCSKCYSGLPCDCLEYRSRNLAHLPSCQMVKFGPVVPAPNFAPKMCDNSYKYNYKDKIYSADGGFMSKMKNWFY